MRSHYHVTVGSEGGYLPDANYQFTSRRQAEMFAASEASQFMDDGWEIGDGTRCEYSKSGSARSGLIVIDTGRSLDTIIEIVKCDEDCETEE